MIIITIIEQLSLVPPLKESIIIIIIIIIIMKSSIDRDNNYCHYVILRNAGFAITLHYHPAGYVLFKVVYHVLCGLHT
jgi:hypothetical protein